MLNATCHMVESLKTSRFNFTGGVAAKLLSVIFTLLLEILSMTIKLTMKTECDAQSISIHKDESFSVLNGKMKDWIKVVMLAHRTPNPLIFGGGMKRDRSWWNVPLEVFVDLNKEFEVLDYVCV